MNRESISGERVFLAICIVVFLTSAAGTIYLCRSMSGGMTMPGGWTMSMAWMRMPGQSWAAAAAMFVGMWLVMMVAMMLPSLVPTLSSYRRSLHAAEKFRYGTLTLFAGAGYFLVWAIVGVVAYGLGLVTTTAEMQWLSLARSVPIATGAVILIAGLFQLTAWKRRRLAKCRDVLACNASVTPNAGNALRQGMKWGLDCFLCCLGFMTALLVTGVMSLAAMAALAVAITAERLLSGPERVARIAGIAIITAGAFVIARALFG